MARYNNYPPRQLVGMFKWAIKTWFENKAGRTLSEKEAMKAGSQAYSELVDEGYLHDIEDENED